MVFPARVKIVEVGPRDGLQNEAQIVPTAIKVSLIERLVAAGCRSVEATSFVAPKRVPQMGDHAEVMRLLKRKPGVAYPVLTPNLKGFEAALAAGAEEVAIFAAASESFSQKNINCSIAESLSRFEPLMASAKKAGVKVRGYVSCVLGCPYEGEIAPAAVASVAAALDQLGCYEISLGDTIGVGRPDGVQRLIESLSGKIGIDRLAGHFHDTYGMAVANVFAALEMGMAIFDSSVGGLGGCPYAEGATGNVATEDLVWLLNGMNIETGINLAQLVDCAVWISGQLGREPFSRVSRALKR